MRIAKLLACIGCCLLGGVTQAASPPTEARELLDRWLAAQNAHDLVAYDKLYAETFTGVRRSGARVVSLDRAAWMKERKRMFARPITVEAKDIVVAMIDRGATIHFTQTFATPTFSDQGPKELVLARGPGGLQIVREEMLSSKIDAEQRAAGKQTLSLEQFAFVVNGQLVLDPDVSMDDAKKLIRGQLRQALHKEGWEIELRGTVPLQRVAKRFAALRGKHYRVFGNAGQLCDAVVSDHFAVRVAHDDYDSSEHAPPLPRKVGLAELDRTDVVFFATQLVVELTATTGRCGEGRWARAAELPTAVRFAQKERGPLEEAAVEATRKLPAFDRAQREYEKNRDAMVKAEEIARPAPARWEQLPEAWRVDSIRGEGSALVWARAVAGVGCGGYFSAFEWGLFEVKSEGGALQALRRGSGPDDGYDYFHPVALVDLDGDGTEELIVDEGEYGHTYIDYAVYSKRDGLYRVGPTLTRPRTTCHC